MQKLKLLQNKKNQKQIMGTIFSGKFKQQLINVQQQRNLPSKINYNYKIDEFSNQNQIMHLQLNFMQRKQQKKKIVIDTEGD